jgi:hypothetical protein
MIEVVATRHSEQMTDAPGLAMAAWSEPAQSVPDTTAIETEIATAATAAERSAEPLKLDAEELAAMRANGAGWKSSRQPTN